MKKMVFLICLWLVPSVRSQNEKKATDLAAKAKQSFRKYTTDGYEDAVKLYEKSLKEAPTVQGYAGLAETYALLGYEMEQAGERASDTYDLAVSNANRALALDSLSFLSHRALAVAYFSKDAKTHGDLIFQSLNRALTLDSTDAETYYWLWLHLDNDNPESPLIHKALQLNSQLFRAQYALGVLYARRGEYDKAAVHYAACKSINEKNHHPYLSQGIAYSKQKRYESAIVEYRKALSLNSRIKEAYLYLGLAYYYTDRNREAKKMLKKYLELVPDSANKATVESILLEID